MCDWLVPTTDLVLDRGMMGGGVIDIPVIRTMAEAAGYQGAVGYELLSRRWQGEDPGPVLEVINDRHTAACSKARIRTLD